MAEQVENLNNEQTEAPSDLKLDCTIALNRFIFLKGIESHFVNGTTKKSQQENSTDAKIKDYIKKLVETDPLAPLNLIKKGLNAKSFPSNHEALWCLAYCLVELNNEILSSEIRKNFVEMITTSELLLTFMHFYQVLKGGKLNMGRGMRNVLEKWYDSKDSAQLFDILYTKRKFEKMDHKNILHQIHLKLADPEKNKIINSFFKDFKETELNSSVPIERMILRYRQLKHSKNHIHALDVLRDNEFRYKLKHIPGHLSLFTIKDEVIIDILIRNMTLSEVIENLMYFCAHKLLKVQDPISRTISNALMAPHKAIYEAKFHPLYIFDVLKELERKLTIHHDTSHKNENGNATATITESKNIEKKFMNPFIIKKMQYIFNHTLNEQPRTGCRYFITVDFRKFSKRQSRVFGMSNVLCSELQTIIALKFLKNEKDVTVMSFTDDKTKLKPVEWTKETSFEKALEIYEKEIKESPKTKEIITLPLKKAIEDKKKVDVFITFVSSLGRTMGSNGKPTQLKAELENYRTVMKEKMTRYVIVNMTRKSPDIHYDDSNINQKGILEVVGFSMEAAKVIDAYAKNCFV